MSESIIIVGGGALGLSLACHLAWRGATKVTLLERHQLTSGTSWHAAGIVGPLRATPNMTRLAMYAGELFPQLEKRTGLQTGYRMTGGYWLARRAERMDEFYRMSALGRHFGLHPEVISNADLQSRMPLLASTDLAGTMTVAEDASVNPVDLCMAYAAAARAAGVIIREGIQVRSLNRAGNLLSGVTLDNGTQLRADTVALCAGAWSKHIASTVGVALPIQAVEHMYVVTEPHIDFEEFPVVRDIDNGIYIKGDTGKLVIGGFEPDAKLFDVNTSVGASAFIELPEDWQQFMPFMQAALELIPALEDVGVQHFMNGPESFTADTRPLVGQAVGIDNLFVACGMNSVGVMSSAGVGKVLADWIVDDHPPMDLWEIDIARTDPLTATDTHMKVRMREAVADQFAMHWPFKQAVHGRDLRTSPLHQRWADAGAVFGVTAGWERGLWYACNEWERDLPYSVGRQPWLDIVKREAAVLENSAVLLDLTPLSKFELVGANAMVALNRLSAASVDVPIGRVIYTQLLNARGGIEADVTVTRLGLERFRVLSAAATRWRDLAYLRRHLTEGVALRDYTDDCCVIGLMGGGSRALLETLVEGDLPMRVGSVGDITVSDLNCFATRLSFIGEFGWELEVANEQAALLFDTLWSAGASPMGHYAVDACRLEKAYRHWGHDIGPTINPFEAGLGYTVNSSELHLHNHIAADCLNGGEVCYRQLLYLCAVQGSPLMLHDEPVWQRGKIVGLTTSGGVGARTNQTLTFVLFNTEADWCVDQPFEIEVADSRYVAHVLKEPPFDPNNLRMHA